MSFAGGSAAEHNIQPYKYNGKELDRRNDVNLYDYSARHYDPTVARFTTVDPMAEKYYSISPYAYVGNNPMRLIDPTGMIWDDSNDVEKLNKSIDDKINSLNKDISKNQAKLDKGGLSEKQVAKLENKISEAKDRISNLNTSKADIDLLGADQNNVYTLSQTDGGIHQITQASDGKIHIQTSSDALSIHEITHVRQSLNAGGLKFSSDGKLLNAAGDVRPRNGAWYSAVAGNEVEAYKMQYSYDQSFPGRTSNLHGINVHSVGDIRNNGNPVYPLINQYSIFLKQQEKIIRGGR
jgi:RHS repeat-associated protein